MGKRIGPEAKVIALFLTLNDEGKRIVMDVIKSQTAAPRRARVKAPPKVKTAAAGDDTINS